jgi:hypothetical protein
VECSKVLSDFVSVDEFFSAADFSEIRKLLENFPASILKLFITVSDPKPN